MKKVLLVLFLLIFSTVHADFNKSEPVGPGVIYHHVFKEVGPWHIHVLEIDLTNPWITLETVKAQDKLSALERTSSMAGRNIFENHTVIGAINGDFYDGNGTPIGAQVRNGILLKRPTTRSVFGITSDKVPLIDVLGFQGLIRPETGPVLNVNGVNETRGTNQLVIYNRYFGDKTATNQWGTEIITELISADPAVNDTIFVRVLTKDSTMVAGTGNNNIPAGGMVISGHGTMATALNEQVFSGDTVAVLLNLMPVQDRISQLVGGTPRIIRDGQQSVEWAKENIGSAFASDRHPRTAMGMNSDSTKIFMFVVDGRQGGYSVGMSLYEFADYMLGWGIYQGVNLDGGGSTTMVLRDQVANSPSDAGGERSVSNSVQIISSAPVGPLAHLSIHPDEVYMMHSTRVQFDYNGFDQYYNPVTADPGSITWQADARIGEIDANGLFTAASRHDSGYVYVQSGDILDSALVYITKIGSIRVMPDPVILEVGQQQSMVAETRDSYGHLVQLAPAEYQWSVEGDIGTIAALGMFTALKTGLGRITAMYDSVMGHATVKVGIADETILDDFSDTDNWTLTGLRIDPGQSSLSADSSKFVSPPAAGRLDYTLIPGGTSVLYLDCNMPVSGTPVAVGLHVYGDGKKHWLRSEFLDADGEKFLINFTDEATGIDWQDEWKYIEIPFSNAIAHWSNSTATLDFPVTWTRIYLAEANEQKKDSSIIWLDDFKARYLSTGIEKGHGQLPDKFRLEQNYPNPFNPETTIAYELAQRGKVVLEIYDVAGQKVATLVDDNQAAGLHKIAWKTDGQASSIYFCRLKFNDYLVGSRKMVLLK